MGLKLGKHHFEYQISNAFFEIFDYDEYDSDIKVNVVLEKENTMLELSFSMKEVFMFLTLQVKILIYQYRENEFDCSFWRV
jgi:hypothetical protein